MGEIAAVLPVKQMALAKQRLTATMDRRSRRDLIEASLADTLDALRRARRLDHVLIVTNDQSARRIGREFDAEFISEGEDTGHSAAALHGISHLANGERPPDTVILVPADCPMLDNREVDRLLTGYPHPFVTVIPDRHGTGTNALVLSPPGAITPAFGDESRARHESLARSAGVPYATEELPSLGLDLDTPGDLVAFATAYGLSDGTRGRRTAKVLGA